MLQNYLEGMYTSTMETSPRKEVCFYHESISAVNYKIRNVFLSPRHFILKIHSILQNIAKAKIWLHALGNDREEG